MFCAANSKSYQRDQLPAVKSDAQARAREAIRSVLHRRPPPSAFVLSVRPAPRVLSIPYL
eukprot:7666662-Pyramimonas_sp.AAC.1